MACKPGQRGDGVCQRVSVNNLPRVFIIVTGEYFLELGRFNRPNLNAIFASEPYKGAVMWIMEKFEGSTFIVFDEPHKPRCRASTFGLFLLGLFSPSSGSPRRFFPVRIFFHVSVSGAK